MQTPRRSENPRRLGKRGPWLLFEAPAEGVPSQCSPVSGIGRGGRR